MLIMCITNTTVKGGSQQWKQQISKESVNELIQRLEEMQASNLTTQQK